MKNYFLILMSGCIEPLLVPMFTGPSFDEMCQRVGLFLKLTAAFIVCLVVLAIIIAHIVSFIEDIKEREEE